MSELSLEAALKVIDEEKQMGSDHKDYLKRIFRALCGGPEEKTYSIGDRFRHSYGEEYILVASGAKDVLIVCLQDGGHWAPPISVCNPTDITHDEFCRLCCWKQNEFTQIEKP